MIDEKKDFNTENTEEEIHDHEHGHDHEDGHNHDHEHDHDHDHDHDHEATVIMENEDGTTEEYPVVDEFEYNDAIYVLVENEDGTVTPLRHADDEGELEFLTEEEFNEVAQAYNEFMEEYGEDWDDEDDEDLEEEDLEDEELGVEKKEGEF